MLVTDQSMYESITNGMEWGEDKVKTDLFSFSDFLTTGPFKSSPPQKSLNDKFPRLHRTS